MSEPRVTFLAEARIDGKPYSLLLAHAAISSSEVDRVRRALIYRRPPSCSRSTRRQATQVGLNAEGHLSTDETRRRPRIGGSSESGGRWQCGSAHGTVAAGSVMWLGASPCGRSRPPLAAARAREAPRRRRGASGGGCEARHRSSLDALNVPLPIPSPPRLPLPRLTALSCSLSAPPRPAHPARSC